MDGFLQQLRRHWAERFGSGPRHLVVAVSGGLDSMVLLHSLARLRRKFPWQLTVAHCHHGLRGIDADGDADWVRAQSAALGLPCIVEEVSVRAAAEASRESLEMAARRLRHAFLARSALSVGSADSMEVVLAHHAQDQAELILLRLLRGAGSEGLAGMKERSPSPADQRVSLLRPFLGFDRGTLEAFARSQGIGHREDASNRDLSIPRNRIRHQLIPDWMSHHSPALPRVLARIADIAAHESDYLREQAQRWRDSLHPEPWASLHVALQRAILRMELIEH
jgi:tRNA(Ile)-lysidine synthase